ncbi:MAG: hypothetical protein AAF580_18045 [Pseudomonadota bacterium]
MMVFGFAVLGAMFASLSRAEATALSDAIGAAAERVAPTCGTADPGDVSFSLEGHRVFVTCSPQGMAVTAALTLDLETCGDVGAAFLGMEAADQFRTQGGAPMTTAAGMIMRTFSICTLQLFLPLASEDDGAAASEAG